MTVAPSKIEAAEFASVANEITGAWERVVGVTIEHSRFGMGQITKVTLREKHPPLMDIEFDDRSCKFNGDSFKGGHITHVHMPSSLAAEFLIWKSNLPAILEDKASRDAKRLSAHQAHQAAVEKRRIQRLSEYLARQAAEEERRKQRLSEYQARQAAEEERRMQLDPDRPWKEWVNRFRRELATISRVEPPVERALTLLSNEDRALCLTWAKRPLHESQPIEHQWQKFVESEKNEALRMWSARSAENAAIAFFTEMGNETKDISVQQLSEGSTNWITHDIEVNGTPVDVKNARSSYSNPGTYVGHVIPSFKQTRQFLNEVAVLGVHSDYRSWQKIENEDFGEATILGLLRGEDLAALDSWLKINFDDVLDISLLCVTRLDTYPGWLFDYPVDWYPWRSAALKEIAAILSQCPEPDRAKDVIPRYVYALLTLNEVPQPSAQTQLEDELFGKFVVLLREVGLTRRSLFGWILGTMLQTFVNRTDVSIQDTVLAVRELLFGSDVEGQSAYPAGLYDPHAYIANLISMFEAIGRQVKPEYLRSMRFFKLTSPNILRGQLSNGRWQTVYAYCGGWRTYPVTALCGANPIHLGNSVICPDCGYLICKECAFCSNSCPSCDDRQSQHSREQREQASVSIQDEGLDDRDIPF